MNQKMHVCSVCGLGYLGVETCPRCDSGSNPRPDEIHIPWVRTRTGWAQERLDGSTWILSDQGPRPTSERLVGKGPRTCQSKKHTYIGTAGAKCPFCGSGASRLPSATLPEPASRDRTALFGWVVLLLLIVGGAIAIVVLSTNEDPVPVAIEPPPSTTEATTTSTTIPMDDPEFLDARSYEAEMLAIGTRVERAANRVLEINAEWDSREITQDQASAQLALQRTEARRIVAAVDDARGYGANAFRHDVVATAVQEFADAVAGVRGGLLEPGSRVGRDEATLETVGAADRLLEAIDDALDLDQRRLERGAGTAVSWASLRVGDCVDPTRQGDYTAIVPCSEAGHGEVLATPTLPGSTDLTPIMCAKAAWPVVDPDAFDPAKGSWEIHEGLGHTSGSSHVCTYIPEAATDALVESNTPHTGPFASDQWDALARLDLVPVQPVEVGECLIASSEDGADWTSDRYRVGCDEDHDFIISGVAAIASPEGPGDLERFDLRSWDVCSEATSEWLDGDPYLVADALVYPAFPGIGGAETPMLTLACVMWTEPLSDNSVTSYDYQAGYALAFIAAQAGVYDYGLIEDPESAADVQYNDGYRAGQSDVTDRLGPVTEMTNDEWIAAYLVGNPIGWEDGQACAQPNQDPVPPGLNPVESEGWYAGYIAGLGSACNAGTEAPSWVGESVCPYDPWEVHAIDQDVLCPPVRP